MSEAAIPERARYGARQAMPVEGYVDQVRGIDLGDLDVKVSAAARAAEADLQQVALQAADVARRYPELVEWLLDNSLRRPTFVRGLTMEAAAMFAANREGGNALAWQVIQLIAIGRGEMPPAREDV